MPIEQAEDNEDNWDGKERRRAPIREIIELESRIADREAAQNMNIQGLKDELKDLRESIKDLITILETLKNFAKFVGFLEKTLIFLTKIGAAIGFFYAVYKFGLMEIATKVKSMGGP